MLCCVRAACGGASRGGLVEGQGCVYNVNTVEETNKKGREERETRAPSGSIHPQTNRPLLLRQPNNKGFTLGLCRGNAYHGFANYQKHLTMQNISDLNCSLLCFIYFG